MEECPTPICLVQTHCIVMTQHFLILLFILDKIKTGEVCKESVNDQRSCRGRSIRQAGAPTRMHVNQRCTSKYLRESLHTRKRQFVWRNGDGSHTDYGEHWSLQLVMGFSWALLRRYFTVPPFCCQVISQSMHVSPQSSRTGSIPFYNTSLQRLPTSFILGLLQYQIPPICNIETVQFLYFPITPWSLLTWQLPC